MRIDSVLVVLIVAIFVAPGCTQEIKPESPAAATMQKPAEAKQMVGKDSSDKQATDKSMKVDSDLHRKTVRKAIEFFLEQGQDKTDGSFSKKLGPAVTAMSVTAILQNGHPLNDPKIQKALKYLEGFVKPDGGVYAKDSNLQNYETSVAVMCFAAANKDGKYDKLIQEAIGYQKKIQWDEGENYTVSNTFYGGQGYGKHKRPDMSNTSFFIDALKAAGEDKDSVAMKKAMIFISRTQNLESRFNDSEFATKTNAEDRGGLIYTPAGEGETKVQKDNGMTPEGGLRSYASMTYAGLKSFLYAGLAKDDIRVKAAMDWISRHYDLDTNPGMGQQGLYYYYHVFAKALDANGTRMIKDKKGTDHNWRADLLGELAERQQKDGSWTNKADRWYEGDPNLVTSYSLLALSYCHPDKDK